MNEFKKGYQPRTNIAKGENDDLLAEENNTLALTLPYNE
jgi:hypothetical protein